MPPILITCTGVYLQADNTTPVVGNISLMPRVTRLDTTTGHIIPPEAVVGAIAQDGDTPGLASVVVIASDDPETLPATPYLYREEFEGGRWFDIDVPANTPGGILDLSTVLPAPPGGGGGVSFVLLSLFNAHVADRGAVGHPSHLAPDGTTIVAVAGVLSAVGGTGDSTYVHTQAVPATTWTVLHNLGKHPSVSVVDSAGTQVQGGVHHDSANQCTLTFSAAFSGYAYCN